MFSLAKYFINNNDFYGYGTSDLTTKIAEITKVPNFILTLSRVVKATSRNS